MSTKKLFTEQEIAQLTRHFLQKTRTEFGKVDECDPRTRSFVGNC